MNDIERSVGSNRRLLEQGVELLERLTDEQYRERRGTWAAVGAQYRHVLEHYRCLFAGIDAGVVDYDGRARDQTLEVSRAAAIGATRALHTELATLPRRPGAEPIRVQMRSLSTGPQPEWAGSTLARELQFLVSHTVHHYALIKLLLSPDGIDMNPEFGVAASTLAHARAEQSCAR